MRVRMLYILTPLGWAVVVAAAGVLLGIISRVVAL